MSLRDEVELPGVETPGYEPMSLRDEELPGVETPGYEPMSLRDEDGALNRFFLGANSRLVSPWMLSEPDHPGWSFMVSNSS